MPLQLEIISEHAEIVGDDAVREFGEDGGTIGRSLENDWILPDPDRYISGKHATIDHKGGIYYLADLSTNGVYVNGENEPIGKGNPRRLFNGDVLRMGDFEIKVAIDQGESIAMPIEGERTVVPEPIELPVPETTLRSGVQLLDEDELFGENAFDAGLFGEPDADFLPETPVHEPEPPSAVQIVEELDTDRPTAGLDVDPAGSPSKDLMDAFLDGLGVSRNDLHPTVDAADVLNNAGQVMREFVEGATRLLASRSNLKSSFSLEQTTALPRKNNPLKLAENADELLLQLLVGGSEEYLASRDAVREVCRDLLHHQDAFLEAMAAAFKEFADRFDPDELTSRFDSEMRRIPLLGILNRSKYWQLYCDLYPVMTEKGEAPVPQLLAEEFVKAYEWKISEFKRQGTAGLSNSMAATVRRHVTELVPEAAPVNEDFDPEFVAELESSIAGNPTR